MYLYLLLWTTFKLCAKAKYLEFYVVRMYLTDFVYKIVPSI